MVLPSNGFAVKWFCRQMVLPPNGFADKWFCRQMVLPLNGLVDSNGLAKVHLSFEWGKPLHLDNPLVINSLFYCTCISLFLIILFYLYTRYI